jgi:CRISPR-associated endonuclease Cas1
MATENVRQLSQSDNSTELIVPRHGVVTLFGYGIQVRIDRGHLLLNFGIGPDRYYARLPRVGHGLKRLVCIGSDGMVSLAALRWLSAQDVAFSVLERTGKVLFVTGPVRSSDAKLRRAQALAHSTGAALQIARELIDRKLAAQEDVARHKLLDEATADAIAQFRSALSSADCIATIRLLEAQGAAAYWAAWRTLSINFPKNDLRRIPQHWCTFSARVSALTGSPRLACNPANAILNYLYSLLEAEARLAVSAMGLDPGLGVLHSDTAARDSLCSDVMEPVRAQVDSYVLDLITREYLSRSWFYEQPDGNCRLMSTFASRLSETASTWRRAVAPVAEWVAQALWNSSRRSAKDEQVLPTRLTHRRKSESRGNKFKLRIKPLPRPTKVCEVCGAEGVKSRYCKACAVEASRDHMAQVALIGHSRRKTQRAKDRISKRISDHAVANTWWDPKTLPSWLTEEYYVQRIQPLLRTKKIREIAAAMQVSQPYAAFIRSGRRRPHARHWQTLAELVGV